MRREPRVPADVLRTAVAPGPPRCRDCFRKERPELRGRCHCVADQGLLIRMLSQLDKPIDLLFIDANHEYRAVLRDFNNWVPLSKRGGLLLSMMLGKSTTDPSEWLPKR